MTNTCSDCGAHIPGGACHDKFHALLLLEPEAYGVEHPGSMNYTAGVLAGLRIGLTWSSCAWRCCPASRRDACAP